MKIRAHLGIGFPGAMQEDELEIADEELEGLSEADRDKYIMDYITEWAWDQIDLYYDGL
jgi:hypothetical protein